MKIDIICKICGKSFQDYPYRARTYCSQKCSWIGKSGQPSSRKGTRLSHEVREHISDGLIGRKHSEETKQKIAEANRGKYVSDETRKRISNSKKGKFVRSHTQFKKGQTSWNKGREMSEASKIKLSISHKGKNCTEEHKKKISIALSNRVFQEEHKRKISKAKSGSHQARDRNPNWRGGKSFEPYCIKFNREFKEHIRDKFGRKCFICDAPENGRKLHVHHIDYNKNSICNGKEWAFVSLCASCHSKTVTRRWFWFNLLISYWAENSDINIRGENEWTDQTSFL